ncbi:hypothetical protein ACFL07_09255 [Pseudomonadota bacterium]
MAVEPAPLASDEQVKEAFTQFQTWAVLYQENDYLEQYGLVHPRMQRREKYPVWKKAMSKSLHKNGALQEYVIMTNSDRGWLFGGDTFLNIPFGETMGIPDRQDEKRYEYRGLTN